MTATTPYETRTRLNDETLTMRRLGSSTFVFVASPDFVDRHPVLVHPSDITGLPFLSFQEDTARPSWTLTGPDEAAAVVAFDPILWTSEFSILVEAACAGTGISLLPTEVAVRPISEGRLVRILPGWCSEEVTLHLVFTTAEDWLQRSGSSSTISPTTLFIAARRRRDCSRSSTRRGSRECATTPASMPPPLRHLSRKPRYSGGSARHSNLGFRRSTRAPATALGATSPLAAVAAKDRNPPN
jgi:hypothetical protein